MYLAPNTSWSVGRSDPQFTFSIVNFGRTASNVGKTIIIFEVLAQIPAEIGESAITPDAAGAESAEIIIGPDSPFKFPEMRCQHDFTRENARDCPACLRTWASS
jgi:hypothetical protein